MLTLARCATCGVTLWTAEAGICTQHGAFYAGDQWAAGNRIACDFFHRRLVHPELAERGEDALMQAMRGA